MVPMTRPNMIGIVNKEFEHLPRCYTATDASRLAGDVGDGLSVGTGSSLGECRRTCGSKRRVKGKTWHHGKLKASQNDMFLLNESG